MTTIIHPHRPQEQIRCGNLFMMEFENELLWLWGSRTKGNRTKGTHIKEHPKGRKRFMDHEWAKFVTSQVYPFHSDVDWDDYVDWVANGGGDEWFIDTDDQCMKCGQHEDFCTCVAIVCSHDGNCVSDCMCRLRRETLWAYVNE
jgi:hypothetical protein